MSQIAPRRRFADGGGLLENDPNFSAAVNSYLAQGYPEDMARAMTRASGPNKLAPYAQMSGLPPVLPGLATPPVPAVTPPAAPGAPSPPGVPSTTPAGVTATRPMAPEMDEPSSGNASGAGSRARHQQSQGLFSNIQQPWLRALLTGGLGGLIGGASTDSTGHGFGIGALGSGTIAALLSLLMKKKQQDQTDQTTQSARGGPIGKAKGGSMAGTPRPQRFQGGGAPAPGAGALQQQALNARLAALQGAVPPGGGNSITGFGVPPAGMPPGIGGPPGGMPPGMGGPPPGGMPPGMGGPPPGGMPPGMGGPPGMGLPPGMGMPPGMGGPPPSGMPPGMMPPGMASPAIGGAPSPPMAPAALPQVAMPAAAIGSNLPATNLNALRQGLGRGRPFKKGGKFADDENMLDQAPVKKAKGGKAALTKRPKAPKVSIAIVSKKAGPPPPPPDEEEGPPDTGLGPTGAPPAPGPVAGMKKGGNFIAKAIKNPGALHEQLGVPEDKKIPAKKLNAAAEKGGKLGKRANLAKTLNKLRKNKGGKCEKMAAGGAAKQRKGFPNTMAPPKRLASGGKVRGCGAATKGCTFSGIY